MDAKEKLDEAQKGRRMTHQGKSEESHATKDDFYKNMDSLTVEELKELKEKTGHSIEIGLHRKKGCPGCLVEEKFFRKEAEENSRKPGNSYNFAHGGIEVAIPARELRKGDEAVYLGRPGIDKMDYAVVRVSYQDPKNDRTITTWQKTNVAVYGQETFKVVYDSDEEVTVVRLFD